MDNDVDQNPAEAEPQAAAATADPQQPNGATQIESSPTPAAKSVTLPSESSGFAKSASIQPIGMIGTDIGAGVRGIGISAGLQGQSNDNGGKPLSKRDQIRKRLREKEKLLTDLVSKRGLSLSSKPAAPRQPETEEPEIPIFSAEEKEEADRKEAVKVLSQAATTLKEKLKKQKDEATGLQEKLDNLDSTLQVREQEKDTLEKELQTLRGAMESNQEEMKGLQKQLEERQSTLSSLERGQQEFKEKEKDLQNQLSAAYEEVVWTQKDSMSKAEQIEYFEYELLARNQEIDDLKQDLNEKLRRIVELEVDLEIHDDRFSTVMDEFAKLETSTAKSSTGDSDHIPSSPHVAEEKLTRKGSGLGGLLKFRKRNRSADQATSAMMSQHLDQDGPHKAVDQLQLELSNLQTRYKRDKHQNKSQIEQLKHENNEYLIKVLSLEQRLAKAEEQDRQSSIEQPLQKRSPSTGADQRADTKDSGALPNKTRFLNEKISLLENRNQLQKRTIEDLQAERTRLQGERLRETEQSNLAMEKLRLENEAKAARIVALERQLRESPRSQSSSSLQSIHLNAAAGLEAKLDEKFAEVVRLRKEHEVKDKKIEVLRSEIIELRLLRMQYEKASQNPEANKSKLDVINEDSAGAAENTTILSQPEDKLAWTRSSSDQHRAIETEVLARIGDRVSMDSSRLASNDLRLQYHV